MTVRWRSARARLSSALVRVGRNGSPASAGELLPAGGTDEGEPGVREAGTGRVPGVIGVMPGGGGGTDTGRLPGPVRPGRPFAAAGVPADYRLKAGDRMTAVIELADLERLLRREPRDGESAGVS